MNDSQLKTKVLESVTVVSSLRHPQRTRAVGMTVVMRTIWESSRFSLAAYSFESVSENGNVTAQWRAVVGSASASATTTVTTQKEKTKRIIGIKVDRKRSTQTQTVARGLTTDEIQHVQAVVFEAMESCAEFKAIANSVETV